MARKLPALAVCVLSLTATADAFGAAYATRPPGVGSTGSDVRALQRYLDNAGYDTTADGQFGPATRASVVAFERAEERRANGRATRAEQRLVRARVAASADEQPPPAATEKAYIGEDGLAVAPASAPEEVKAIIAAGNEIATKPYKYGGGHARFPRDWGYDCSGSVSYVLHAAGLLDDPLDSTGFMSWGERGRTWITVRTNPSHAYLIVAGLRFDTSARKQTGTRWSEQMRSARGFRGRHPEGL